MFAAIAGNTWLRNQCLFDHNSWPIDNRSERPTKIKRVSQSSDQVEPCDESRNFDTFAPMLYMSLTSGDHLLTSVVLLHS